MKQIKGILMMMAVGATMTIAQAGTNDGARTVFAHYMTCFSRSDDVYKREIALAQQYGIDGWVLNCGNWQKKDAETGEWVPNEGYVHSADAIFQVAKDMGSNFKLMMSPDGNPKSYIEGNHENQAIRYKDHPNLFHWEGRPVLSGWSGGLEKYKYARESFRKQGLDFCIVPSLGPSRYPMFSTADLMVRDVFEHPDYACDGAFHFACDGTTREMVLKNANMRFAAQQKNQIFMAGVCPAYNSSNLRDFHGVEGYIAQWKGIVNDQPELVEIVTWNDYAEDSFIMPSSAGWREKRLEVRNIMDRDEAFLDLTAYFSAAYKAGGRYPEIQQDKLYVCYRPRPKHLTREFNPDAKGWVDVRDEFLQIHADVQDCVYATAFLIDDAILSITQGAEVQSKLLKKGIASFKVPMIPGETPQFKLEREGKSIFDVSGRRQIVAEETERNSLNMTWHGIGRVWSQASVAGDAEYSFDNQSEDGKSTASVSHKDGVAWKLPSDFKPGSFNFRVKYRNVTDEEARYTFAVEVPWLDSQAPRYFPLILPLFLPSTKGAEREVSFLLTIPEGSTEIAIRQDSAAFTNRVDGVLVPMKGDYSDYGEAEIIGLSLVRNQPWEKPLPFGEMPELVSVPGGTFRMGANAKESDELPVRDVTLSAFAIGKYEITNKEFEQFMPEHRTHRTALSWRDREPVIYVSWREAAGYCNWLSRKKGLTPAYDETTWKVDRAADGFRLPTEAEWEYVASGRGENRIYPWGSEMPNKTLANVSSAEEVFSQSAIATQLTDGGTAIVGSYPEGVSRDGVMDLAGNVAEWCSDAYHYEPYSETVDPLDERPAKSPRATYRSIRGGSWGYYGLGQRVCDREFNNPSYPGYIYIGFRIALPEAGFKQLGSTEKGK